MPNPLEDVAERVADAVTEKVLVALAKAQQANIPPTEPAKDAGVSSIARPVGNWGSRRGRKALKPEIGLVYESIGREHIPGKQYWDTAERLKAKPEFLENLA